jgi:hypothetical protein
LNRGIATAKPARMYAIHRSRFMHDFQKALAATGGVS